MKIANINNLHDGINEIIIDGKKLFIHKNANKIKIYNGICPHQGGRLFCDGDSNEIFCKVHNWRFCASSGKSLNIQSASMFEIDSSLDNNGDIYIADSAIFLHSINANITSTNSSTPPPQPTTQPSSQQHSNFGDFTIRLHSHACLEFRYNDFSLLCDPWIIGSAFFGSWRHYPTPIIDKNNISHLAKRTNAIWISHEHSDHFHPATLQYFNKDITVYVPAFPNGRLEKRLKDLGFSNVIVTPFGKRLSITKDIFITTFEPASLWNDAQVLIEIGGFRILNINDAGINHQIHNIIKTVDCIASAFSPGASGYPATWEHLSNQAKINIYEKSRLATLEMLKEACKMYSAKYFMPFASHFILNNPQHLDYMKILRKNVLDDCLKAFKHHQTKVIGLLAGDIWQVGSKIIKQDRSKDLYEFHSIENHINKDFDKAEFLQQYPNKEQYQYNKDVVFAYFKNLNTVPEMIFCEDLTMNIFPSENESFCIEIRNGKLKVLERIVESANITMKIPSEILMYICVNNESWDEATIGYWCEFSRNPDIYHTEFWRILQCPYYRKCTNPTNNTSKEHITTSSNLAFVLETLGELGEKIFARYGLYCLSCNKAYSESIAQACAMHGINANKMNRLVAELNRVV